MYMFVPPQASVGHRGVAPASGPSISSSTDSTTKPPPKMADALDHQKSGRTRIEWLSSLNTEYKPAKNYRRTSIICTIGPKTNSAEKINVLRKGMRFKYLHCHR